MPLPRRRGRVRVGVMATQLFPPILAFPRAGGKGLSDTTP
jgi:hypothetical protein